MYFFLGMLYVYVYVIKIMFWDKDKILESDLNN